MLECRVGRPIGPPDGPEFSMLTLPRWAIATAITVAVLAAILAPKLLPLAGRDEPAAAVEPEILKVAVHTVVPTRLEETLATIGTIRANEEVDLVSEISGKVSAIHFDEGSRVSEGELLLEIDDSELRAERQRALYRVELAERAEARQKQLLEDGVISSENYDVALAELNVLRSELQLIEAQLVKTRIRAPFAGVIGLRWVSPGSFLTPQTRIASLIDLDPVKLDFTVPERYATLLGPGDDISFRVDGLDRTFGGSVYAIQPSIDSATRSLRVRASCANPDGALLPGSFANVRVAVRSVADALTVPAIAVIPELGGTKVFVYRDGRAEPVSVTTGIRNEREVEITSGLSAGDRVITTGILQLQPGLEVELADDADAAHDRS
jgi:membrane fusion protein (multidrug efflux system)